MKLEHFHLVTVLFLVLAWALNVDAYPQINSADNKTLENIIGDAHKCTLTSAGVTASGRYYQHRLVVDGQPLGGANDLGTALNQLKNLRRQGLCQTS